jgi:hypothetical protein
MKGHKASKSGMPSNETASMSRLYPLHLLFLIDRERMMETLQRERDARTADAESSVGLTTPSSSSSPSPSEGSLPDPSRIESVDQLTSEQK